MKKCQNKLNKYIKNHKNITFSGNKRYIDKSGEYYLKNIKPEKNNIITIKHQKEKEKNKNNKANINLKKKIIPNRNKNSSNYLTPIPIYRNNFNTENKFEKDELNNAERTAVLIRRYEYSVKVRRNNSQEYKNNKYNLVKIIFIQQWWKSLFRIIFIQKIFRGCYFRKKFILLLEKQNIFVERINLISKSIKKFILNQMLKFLTMKKIKYLFYKIIIRKKLNFWKNKSQKIKRISNIFSYIFNKQKIRNCFNKWLQYNRELNKNILLKYITLWKNKTEKSKIKKKLFKYIKENIISISKDLFSTPSKIMEKNYFISSERITNSRELNNNNNYLIKNFSFEQNKNNNETFISNISYLIDDFKTENKIENKISPLQISNETIYYKDKDLNEMNSILYTISSYSENYISLCLSKNKSSSKKQNQLKGNLYYALNEWKKIISLKKILKCLIDYKYKKKFLILWKKKIEKKEILEKIISKKNKKILKEKLIIWKERKKKLEFKNLIYLLSKNTKLKGKINFLLQTIKKIYFKHFKNIIFKSNKNKNKISMLISKISNFSKQKKSIKNLENYIIDKTIEKERISFSFSDNNKNLKANILKKLIDEKTSFLLKEYFTKWKNTFKNTNYENLVNYHSPKIYILGESFDANLLEKANMSIESIPQLNISKLSEESNYLNLNSIINTEKNDTINSNEYQSDNKDIVNMKTPDSYLKNAFIHKNKNKMFKIHNFHCNDNIDYYISKDISFAKNNEKINDEIVLIKPLSFISVIERNNKENEVRNSPEKKDKDLIIIHPNFLKVINNPYQDIIKIRNYFEKNSKEIYCNKLNKSENDINKYINNTIILDESNIIKKNFTFSKEKEDNKINSLKTIPISNLYNNKTHKNSFNYYEQKNKNKRNKDNITQKFLYESNSNVKNGQFYTFGSYDQKENVTENLSLNKINNNEINKEKYSEADKKIKEVLIDFKNNLKSNSSYQINLNNSNTKYNEKKKTKYLKKNPEIINNYNNSINLNKNNNNFTKQYSNNSIENKNLNDKNSAYSLTETIFHNENDSFYTNINLTKSKEPKNRKMINSYKPENFIYKKRFGKSINKKNNVINDSNESFNNSSYIMKNNLLENNSYQSDVSFNKLFSSNNNNKSIFEK